MNTPKILAFSGSTRAASFNSLLIRVAADAARAAGAEVTIVEFRELAIPFYDGDLEEAHGMPAGAKSFKSLLDSCDGILISSPEYNGMPSGVLKNAIDWATRSSDTNEPPGGVFRGKTAALLSASPGGLGGMRGLTHLRVLLGNLGVLVLPDQVCIGGANDAFGPDGKLKDEKKAKQVATLATSLVSMIKKLG